MTTLVDGVLRALLEADGKPLSGQRLAADLGVSRTAIWKSVAALKDEGYLIESQHGLGYLIAKSAGVVRAGEVAARLTTKVMGVKLRHLEEVDSTNREAARWADEGGPEGALVIAERQLAGRGRMGRQWYSREGGSLAYSLLLRPKVELGDAPLITFVAALALAETVARWVPREQIEIKWPNDILLGGKKVAGILLESRVEAASLDYVVLGVGLNVTGGVESFPEEFRDNSTTVALNAEEIPTALELLVEFLERFEEYYDLFSKEGFAPLHQRWNSWFRMIGRDVRVKTGEAVKVGTVVGLSKRGSLEVETAEGVETVHAGDLSFSTTKG